MLITICLVVVTAAAGLYIGTHPTTKKAWQAYWEAHPTRAMREARSQERQRQRILLEQELQHIKLENDLAEFRELLVVKSRRAGWLQLYVKIYALPNQDLQELIKMTEWTPGVGIEDWPYCFGSNECLYDKYGNCVWKF